MLDKKCSAQLRKQFPEKHLVTPPCAERDVTTVMHGWMTKVFCRFKIGNILLVC